MIGTAIDGAKSVVKLAHEYGKMDLYQQAVELMATVTELAHDNFELKQQVITLKDQIVRLQETKALRDAVRFKHNAYFLDRPSENDPTVMNEDGPFCSHCFDADNVLIRLHKADRYHPQCPKCKAHAYMQGA